MEYPAQRDGDKAGAKTSARVYDTLVRPGERAKIPDGAHPSPHGSSSRHGPEMRG